MPPVRSLAALREAAAGCRACELWKRGTQTVFGAGPRRARVMLVGEQPGHDEDLAGEPFIGPAGKVLDRALDAAGVDRAQTYVTNVVKHFKWVPKGKRRIHAKPNAVEITACLPWLQAELDIVKPTVLVCLGATAAQGLIGRQFKVTQHRGEWVKSPLAEGVTATVHPSSILRAPDEAARREAFARFVDDLAKIPAFLSRHRAA